MTQKLALVGIGKIARDQHIPTIAASTAFDLGATASQDTSATVDGIAAYTSLADLLAAQPDIPCVSLCTPPGPRYGDARLALEAGRHVMLEKPPGATLSEVHALQSLAAEKGVTLFATWHSREAMAVDAAREWLTTRTLRNLQIIWKEDVRYWHPGQDWIWQAGGFGVFDPGINALSVMTAILPDPVHLASADLHFPSNRDTPVAADLTFNHSGGAKVTAELDWLEQGPPTWTIHLSTNDGDAELTEGGARFSVGGVEQVAGEDQEYARLYNRFAELVATSQSDVDLSPMRHVADAFTLGRRVIAPPFDW